MSRGKVTYQPGQEYRKEFVKLFQKLTYKQSNRSVRCGWQVWQDFVYMSAAALSQPCNFRQDREDEYMRIIGRYDKQEQAIFPQMWVEIVEAFEQERYADILGDLYMQLEMYNKWRGQFFTPFNVCYMMSKMAAGDVQGEIDKKGYTSVSDPCCGGATPTRGGAMLIAFAKNCFEQGVNYHDHVLFNAQDIDPVVARMCYIQLSLLGCAGHVIIGNSLLFEQNEIWYTPFYFRKSWHYRRMWKSMTDLLTPEGNTPCEKTTEERAPPVEIPPVLPEKETAKHATQKDPKPANIGYEQLKLF